MTIQVVANFTNQQSLCIGEITSSEAEYNGVDEIGTYLMALNKAEPTHPCTVLAKFVSEEAAVLLGKFFRLHGHMEMDQALR